MPQAALMWLASELVFAALTYFAVVLLPSAASASPTSASLADLILAWRRHDTYWYLLIAQGGYSTEQMTAFFPLYPLLIRLVVAVIGPHWTISALLVSALGRLGTFVGLALLAEQEWDLSTAWRTVMIAMAAPFAFFLAAPWTEGVFIPCAIFTLLFARRGAWIPAALCALLAGFTRATAVALALPLLWEFGRHHGWWQSRWWQSRWWRWEQLRRLVRPRVVGQLMVVLTPVPLAFLSLMGYFGIRYGHPLLIINSHRLYWSRNSVPIWQTLGHVIQVLVTTPFLSSTQALQLLDAVPVYVTLVLMLLMVRRLPFAFTLYTAGALYFAIATPITNTVSSPIGIQSAGRFLLAAFPIYAGLALWAKERPWLEYLLVSGGFLLQGVLLVFYLSNGWIV